MRSLLTLSTLCFTALFFTATTVHAESEWDRKKRVTESFFTNIIGQWDADSSTPNISEVFGAEYLKSYAEYVVSVSDTRKFDEVYADFLAVPPETSAAAVQLNIARSQPNSLVWSLDITPTCGSTCDDFSRLIGGHSRFKILQLGDKIWDKISYRDYGLCMSNDCYQVTQLEVTEATDTTIAYRHMIPVDLNTYISNDPTLARLQQTLNTFAKFNPQNGELITKVIGVRYSQPTPDTLVVTYEMISVEAVPTYSFENKPITPPTLLMSWTYKRPKPSREKI